MEFVTQKRNNAKQSFHTDCIFISCKMCLKENVTMIQSLVTTAPIWLGSLVTTAPIWLGWFIVFKVTLNNISVISWQLVNCGGNWNIQRKPQTCCKSLTNFIT